MSVQDPQRDAILADALAAAHQRGHEGDDALALATMVTDAILPFARIDRALLRDVEPATWFVPTETAR